MPAILSDIPESPTLRDLYQLVAVTAQQISNYGDELGSLRVELTRLIAQQAENISAHQDEIRRLDRNLADVRVQVEAVKAWQWAHQFSCPLFGNGRESFRQTTVALMHTLFSPEELNDVGFQVGIEMNEIGGDGHKQRARELLLAAERRGLITRLLTICRQLRPQAAWPLPYD